MGDWGPWQFFFFFRQNWNFGFWHGEDNEALSNVEKFDICQHIRIWNKEHSEKWGFWKKRSDHFCKNLNPDSITHCIQTRHYVIWISQYPWEYFFRVQTTAAALSWATKLPMLRHSLMAIQSTQKLTHSLNWAVLNRTELQRVEPSWMVRKLRGISGCVSPIPRGHSWAVFSHQMSARHCSCCSKCCLIFFEKSASLGPRGATGTAAPPSPVPPLCWAKLNHNLASLKHIRNVLHY